MVAVWNAFKTKYDSETAWRLSFLVPAAIVFCVAIGQLFLADDCPKGNYKELEAHGAMTRKSSAVSFKKVKARTRVDGTFLPSEQQETSHVPETLALSMVT